MKTKIKPIGECSLFGINFDILNTTKQHCAHTFPIYHWRSILVDDTTKWCSVKYLKHKLLRCTICRLKSAYHLVQLIVYSLLQIINWYLKFLGKLFVFSTYVPCLMKFDDRWAVCRLSALRNNQKINLSSQRSLLFFSRVSTASKLWELFRSFTEAVGEPGTKFRVNKSSLSESDIRWKMPGRTKRVITARFSGVRWRAGQ